MVRKPRWLIVTADDFNLTSGISRGIRVAHQKGIVTSTSLLVTRPVPPLDVAWLKAASMLSVGMHFSLDLGSPLSAAARRKLGTTPGRLGDGLLDSGLVGAELEAQYEAFVSCLGVPPTHLETNHSLRSHPAVLDALLGLARSFGIPVRSLDDGTRVRIKAAALPTPDATVGGASRSMYWTADRLRRSVEKLAPGVSEFVCHPSPREDRVASPDQGFQTEEELRVLSDPALKGLVGSFGVTLVGYRDLPRIRAEA